ncbi:holo-ACP synthase [Halalkalibacter akibai]|uniref:Holo-[acyl-carrier-protein] synthase n=1 Tax=Halalkalibacter akibai (strain ATCC 43226 / DSM 21942 / CIP 109018 / JCM 9157 / 1139) TaxID=1236973 RepID=W4R002_HALA3|nr:holo-ACP synthase [Halalkalibacter akibai]GAE36894.1 holo-[acyl-carrier protein] synthase [Halalkalibacter akibai JCM 9157]
MIIGTGIDIVEIDRITKVLERQPRFVDRILTSSEKETFFTLQGTRKFEFFAGRFAAKEAFVKAIGTGISKSYSWLDIEVKRESSGKPILVVPGVTHQLHLSISHSKTYAIAHVLIESLSS